MQWETAVDKCIRKADILGRNKLVVEMVHLPKARQLFVPMTSHAWTPLAGGTGGIRGGVSYTFGGQLPHQLIVLPSQLSPDCNTFA